MYTSGAIGLQSQKVASARVGSLASTAAIAQRSASPSPTRFDRQWSPADSTHSLFIVHSFISFAHATPGSGTTSSNIVGAGRVVRGGEVAAPSHTTDTQYVYRILRQP